jgi:hypothetical protein
VYRVVDVEMRTQKRKKKKKMKKSLEVERERLNMYRNLSYFLFFGFVSRHGF